MPHRAPWIRVLLLALLLQGQSWAATLVPITIAGIADTVFEYPDGTFIFNDTTAPPSLA
jgi:hypothetical protein